MKTAANIIAFFGVLFGLLVGWMLIYNGGSLRNPVTWVLFFIGLAIESAILRAVYKDRKNSNDPSVGDD